MKKDEALERLKAMYALAEQIIANHVGGRFVDKEMAEKIIAMLAQAREAVTCQTS